jgi:hypothetical protein
MDDVPERRRFRRRRLGIKFRDVEFGKVGRYVTVAAALVKIPKLRPIVLGEVAPRQVAPSDVVATVVGRQVDILTLSNTPLHTEN